MLYSMTLNYASERRAVRRERRLHERAALRTDDNSIHSGDNQVDVERIRHARIKLLCSKLKAAVRKPGRNPEKRWNADDAHRPDMILHRILDRQEENHVPIVQPPRRYCVGNLRAGDILYPIVPVGTMPRSRDLAAGDQVNGHDAVRRVDAAGIDEWHRPREPYNSAHRPHGIHEAQMNQEELVAFGLMGKSSRVAISHHSDNGSNAVSIKHANLTVQKVRAKLEHLQSTERLGLPAVTLRDRECTEHIEDIANPGKTSASPAVAGFSVGPPKLAGQSSSSFVKTEEMQPSTHKDKYGGNETGNWEEAVDLAVGIIAGASGSTNPYRNGKSRAVQVPGEPNVGAMDEATLVKLLKEVDERWPNRHDSGIQGAEIENGEHKRWKGKGKATTVPGQWSDQSFIQYDPTPDETLQLRERIDRRFEEFLRVDAVQPGFVDYSQAIFNSLQPHHQRPTSPSLDPLTIQDPHSAASLELHLECQVCGDQKPYLDFPSAPPTFTCTHEPNSCTECTHHWLACELSSKGLRGIKCPECPALLTHFDISTSASPATFEKYDALAAREAMSADEGFFWCRGVGCSNGQFLEDSDGFMRCAECQLEQCVKHGAPWHVGKTCEAYEASEVGREEREKQEAESEGLVGRISKVCPGKKCGARIMKNSGCDHMTCRRCRHEFCWQCLASQAEIRRLGNTAHAPNCEFHSDNLKITWPFNVH